MFQRFRAGTGDKSPLSIPGDGRGVLCLHGITGTPFEVRPLAEALRARRLLRRGADARGARRHAGRSRRHPLARLVRAPPSEALERLERRTGRSPTAICGFSMGGLLALRLARLFPERVAALVVMSTPLRLRPLEVLGDPDGGAAPGRLSRPPAGRRPQAERLGRLDPGDALRNPGLRAFPIAALEGLFDLMDVVRADLPSIRDARAGRARAARPHRADGGLARADRQPSGARSSSGCGSTSRFTWSRRTWSGQRCSRRRPAFSTGTPAGRW